MTPRPGAGAALRLRRGGRPVPGRRVLITGASHGIGARTAEVLASRGARLLVTGRDEVALGDVAARCRALAHPADLADPAAVEGLARWAVESGPPDVVILGAGVGWSGALTEMADADLERLVAVNLVAPMRLTRLLLPTLTGRDGAHLLLVSSVAGHIGVREEAVYAATKAALRVFADAVRWEAATLPGPALRVSVVSPGAVATGFFERRGRPYDRSWPRPVDPARVAVAVAAALERPREEVFVPGWLRLPARLQGAAPALVGRLARRAG